MNNSKGGESNCCQEEAVCPQANNDWWNLVEQRTRKQAPTNSSLVRDAATNKNSGTDYGAARGGYPGARRYP